MKSSIYALLIAGLCGLMSSAIAAPLIERIGAPLAHPWGMDFLDDSTVLVTERSGKLYKINLADGTRQPITGLPDIEARRQGGLLDIAIATLDNGPATVFFCYSKPVTGGSVTAIEIGRAHV